MLRPHPRRPARCRSSASRSQRSSPTAGSTRWPPTTTGSTPANPSCTSRPTSTCSTASPAARVRRRASGADVDRPSTVTGSIVAAGCRGRRRCHASPTRSCLPGAVVGRAGVVANSVVMGRIGERRTGVTDSVLGAARARRSRASTCRANAALPTDVDVRRTGRRGAGFLGSHLVDRLHRRGQRGRRRRRPVERDRSANLADARAAGGALKIHTLDVLADEFATLIGMRHPDVVYHLVVAAARPTAPLPQAGRARAGHAGGARGAPGLQGVEGGRGPAGRRAVRRGAARDLPIKEGQPGTRSACTAIVAKAVVDLLNAVPRPITPSSSRRSR